MIGDRLLVYDPETDMFYQGRNKDKITCDGQHPHKWTPWPKYAKCTNALNHYRRLGAELGGGVRIVSETEARRIVMMRKYREARNG
jgi:hypothetical protein